MSFWNIGSWADIFSPPQAKSTRKRDKSRSARPRSGKSLRFEALESRQMLSVSMGTINDIQLPGSKTVYVPLNGTDTAGKAIQYTFSSPNSALQLSLQSKDSASLVLHIQASGSASFSGDLVLHLFEDLAPQTTARIEQLVNQGYYNGLDFFRIIDGFVAQGGRSSTPTTQQLDDEFNPSLTFTSRGLLAMANAGDDTGTAEFFITAIDAEGSTTTPISLADMPEFLNFQHTIFGQLVSGFDLFEQIMSTPVQANGSENSDPLAQITITSAEIIHDTQNAVLKVVDPAGLSGSAQITVTATSPDDGGSTTSKTFTVAGVADTVADPPFLSAPVPNMTAIVGHSVQFQLTATNIDNAQLQFASGLLNPSDSSKATISVDPTTGQVTITPVNNFQGTVSFRVGVGTSASSQLSDFDTETFTVTWGNDSTLKSLSGFAFVDSNGNGIHDTGDIPLAGILVTATGVDANNVPLSSMTTRTGADGSYHFTGVAPGTWTIREMQVTGLPDGVSKQGSLGGTADTTNSISGIVVTTADGGDYNFTEGKLPTPKISLNLFLASTPPQQQSYSTAIANSNIPAVLSIVRNSSNPTNAGSVSYLVTFSEAVTGVNAADFNLVTTGSVTGASVTGVTALSSSVYRVTVSTGSGSGTLALRLADDDSIADAAANKLGGTGAGNGTFVGEFFSLTRQAAVKITSVPDISNQNETMIVVTGTGEPGQQVTITADDHNSHLSNSVAATVQPNGTWTSPPIDVSGLDDTVGGATGVTFTAEQVDSAGVHTTATQTVNKHAEIDPPTLTASSIPALVNQANVNSVVIQGTTTAPAITITIQAIHKGDANKAVLKTWTNQSALDGTGPFAWSVPLTDLNQVPDQDLEFIITASNDVGSTAVLPDDPLPHTTKDTTASLTLNVDPMPVESTTPNTINATQLHTVHVSGHSSEASTSFDLKISDSDTTTAVDKTVSITTDNNGDYAQDLDLSAANLKDGALTFSASISDTHGNTGSAPDVTKTLDTTINVAITGTPTAIDINNQKNVVISGTSDGTSVEVQVIDSVNGNQSNVSIPVTNGNWTTTFNVSDRVDGTLTFRATATDQAKNSATSGDAHVTKTTVQVTSNTTINTANADSYSISGTGQVGSSVALTIHDSLNATANTTPASQTIGLGGDWSFTGTDVSSLKDGNITITATATSTDGNGTHTATNTTTVLKDTTAPTGSFDSLDSQVTLTNQANVLASGAADTSGPGPNGVDTGVHVILTATDSIGHTAQSPSLGIASGHWMTSIAKPFDLSNLVDGAITVEAVAIDGAGNSASLGSKTLQKHSVDITSISTINDANKTNVTVSGHGQEGATVTVTVSDGANPDVTSASTTVSGGQWSITGIDVSSLDDGTLTFIANATDGTHAGSFTTTAVKDTVAPGLQNVSIPDPIDSMSANDVTVSGAAGSTEASATIKLTVTDSLNATVNPSDVAAANDGSWSFADLDLSSLADGQLTFSFDVTDLSGNHAVFSQTVMKA